jgi:hypothetical protein
MHVKDEEMPESLQERFATFKHELTKEKAIANEGTVQATTQRMSDEEASKWASEIVSMFIEIVKDES